MAFLEVKNIKKIFDGETVLHDINFEVEKGEVLAIIGSSGSGKTTLLRIMNFLTQPDEGTMTLRFQGAGDATDSCKKDSPKAGQTEEILNAATWSGLSEDEMRRNRLHFGLVFQQFNLFPQYTVLENLLLAPKLMLKEQAKKLKKSERGKYMDTELAKLSEKASELLDRVNLSNRKDAYPCELSGGMKQRVAIARALMMSPDILCFDEPTSALDPELTGEVLSVIRGLKSGDSTMIVVTHEMEFARNVADKVIFMADGIIEESGTPEEIFGNPKSEKLKSFLSKAMD